MESLAYLHLALANEAPADSDYTRATSGENPKLLNWLTQQKLPTSATIHLLSLTVALGMIGMAGQASAAVQQGDSGAEVTALQQRLKELGYFQGNATGYFGPVTKEAVRQFQQAKGLNPDGVVGTNTSNVLNEQPQQKSETESLPSSGLLQLGDRGEQVSAIQKRLTVAGFSGGEAGNFDETTEEAVRRFQQAKGLKVDGIVGKQTLAALPELDGTKSAPATPSATPETPTTSATPETPTKSATPEQKKPTSFFENEEGSLSPFIRKPD
jgi:peptidoglycan hydrolase-like protein with peptidoglycan-binding domain